LKKIFGFAGLQNIGAYVPSFVLLEFGARNVTEPNEQYTVKPYIADILPTLNFPQAKVTVLSPARTFWEKATLIHVECNRGQLKQNAARLSRHWYDLVMIAEHDIGKTALANKGLLNEVIKHKTIFFNTSYARYDECLNGKFQLVPDEKQLTELKKDYLQMISAKMFYQPPFEFDQLIQKIKILEEIVNKKRI
jgi:hypothetical protein